MQGNNKLSGENHEDAYQSSKNVPWFSSVSNSLLPGHGNYFFDFGTLNALISGNQISIVFCNFIGLYGLISWQGL